MIKGRQYSAAEVSARFGVSPHSLYAWIKKYEQPEPVRILAADQQARIKKLQAELKRVTEERDIIKKGAEYSTREDARRDIFDYIEMFYNPRRRHGYANRLSPVEFEKQYFARLERI